MKKYSRKNRNHTKNRQIKKEQSEKPKTDENISKIDFETNPSEFFQQNSTLDQHYEAQCKNKIKYLATLMAFDEYSIEIAPGIKAKIVAAAFARTDRQLSDYLLKEHKQFGFTDVLKSLTMLDSHREKKALEKKLARITNTGSVMKPKNVAKFKVDLNNLEVQIPTNEKCRSCNGALARYIRKWVRSFKESELEFFALQLPTQPWQKLADIVHLNPTKDFPNAPWFLPFCFGKNLPEGSKIEKCKNMNKNNVNELVAEFNLPYSFVKTFKNNLNDRSKAKLANSTDNLDSIIWFYEDLKCPEVNDIIRARLENGEELKLGYGKLMERLLMLKDFYPKESLLDNSIFGLIIPSAEKRLKSFKSTLPEPVAVLGDASASMSVAIRTATIISSLLTAICSAKLSFFNNKNWNAELDPKKIADVLELAYKTKASCSTAPAVGLIPYYDNNEIIKTFIIVTDEEENTSAYSQKDKTDYRFFKLFQQYRRNVYPATLIFISFLRSQHDLGYMYREFVRENVSDVKQFKFSGERPDLTKLDSILGSLCSQSSESFDGRIENLVSKLEDKFNNTMNLEDLENLKSSQDQPVKSAQPVKTESISINMI